MFNLTVTDYDRQVYEKELKPFLPKEFVDFPETTKENKEFHGWGLPTVKETAEKYNGKMKCVKENDTFVVTIMMMFDVSEK